MLLPCNWPLNEKGEKLMLRMCPYCAEIMTKDEGCEHTVCSNCKKEFNFCCSSKRQSFYHGIHYHRQSCRFFQVMDQDQQKYLAQGCLEDKFNEKCDQC
mmetsp:Transcript_3203/g.3123  ORF Transcript_3203/g.3123 Transcript_3203/m.3123 type:complete len:99 (+) Transcript_3203:209-505(+)